MGSSATRGFVFSKPPNEHERTSPKSENFCPQAPTPKQTEFLQTDAFEAFYGGAAGGGKSSALLMAALAHVDKPHYAALLLRRSYADLSLPGALMDRANDWLRGTAARWRDKEKTWAFPSGATITFGYLENENDKYRYQGCFHPDTELLTAMGWKPIRSVELGEAVATLDPASRQMEYRPVVETWEYPFDGELVTLNQRQGSAFAVTPNHSVWASTLRRRNLQKFRADSLPYTARIPQWAHWQGMTPPAGVVFATPGARGKTLRFKTADWLEFLGWYLAEGYCESSRWAINLVQCNPEGRRQIEDLLGRLGVNYHVTGKRYSFNNRALAEFLIPLGKSLGKRIPYEVKFYRREDLRILLRSLVEGDGTWRDPECRLGHFVSGSRQLADDVCEVAIKAGYRATICERQGNPPGTKFGTRPRFHVSLMECSEDTRIETRNRGKVTLTGRQRYVGPVYCVTVPPYHTVLTRYNGRISWSGQSELQFIAFDEATQFSESQYRYLLSRIRRPQGADIPLRARAASNPGGVGHEWVKRRFIEEGPTAGRVFIPARLEDNPHLDQAEYRKSLEQLDHVTRAQLLSGDWDILPEGALFKRAWFPVAENAPEGLIKVRYWDLAATEPEKGKDPDYTVGLLLGKSAEGVFYVLDVQRCRESPAYVERLVRQTAELDGKAVPVYMEEEGGSSGKAVTAHYRSQVLAGWPYYGIRSTGSKIDRARPVSSQAEGGNLRLVSAPWNSVFLDEIAAFPADGVHDDQVDALSGAVAQLTSTRQFFVL